MPIFSGMASKLSNPFFFETPSNKWEFTDRASELKQLGNLLSSAGRRILIYGRRRMGKTSLLEEAARRLGGKLILVDVSTAASVAELSEKLLAAAPKPDEDRFQRVLKVAQSVFKSVTVKAGKISLGGEFRPLNDEKTLESALDFLHECSAIEDSKWTVAFDEFQDLRVIGGDKADWRLRGVIQKHRHLNYVFSGSDHRIVDWMTNPAAPFFKQLQQLEIGPIPTDLLCPWLCGRSRAGGMGRFPFAERIVEVAGPCTGDIVRLAKAVFDLAHDGTKGDIVASAFDAISLVELNTEFNALWRNIQSSAARSMLRAIAEGQPPTSAETIKRYGIKSASTAGTAVASLLDRMILARDAKGRVIFDSPFFRRWVEFNAA
jgi:uncharacterized protein